MGISMLNISFFGASVTAQKTGYVSHFFNHKKFNVNQHGYGSMHIRDAGMCFIDDVLEANPDYCFLDWFSTVYTPKDQELHNYLDNFRYKFISKNCQIVFLLFGGSESHMSKSRLEMYDQLIDYSKKYNIPYINLYEHVKDKESKTLFRDMVHTLDLGSEIYGNKIYKEFTDNILDKYPLNSENLIKNKYEEIKKIKLEKQIVEDFIKIKGNGELIGICQNIGPYSGIVNIEADGVFSNQRIWDVWCYYERKVIKIQKTLKNYLNIFVSQEYFDRSSAKQQVDWNVKKVIKPFDYLYYIGDIESVEAK
jgi:hypothetical protein